MKKAFAAAILGLFALAPMVEASTRLSGARASFPARYIPVGLLI